MEQLQIFTEFLARSLFTLYGRTYTVGQVLLVPLVILLGLYGIASIEKLTVRQLSRRSHDKNLILLLDRLYRIAAYLGLILIVLSILNIPLTAFAFVSGALAIGVGFGAQNIVNNFISGWILMWERPISIGDYLEIGTWSGTVETINTRSTRIRRVDGVRLLVPNSQLLENTVVNWNLVDSLNRGQVRVGVDYGSDVRQVQALIYQAVGEHKDVCAEPRPLVIFEDFGQGALFFELYFWVDTSWSDLRCVRSDIRFRIHELFKDAGITLAYTSTVIHMDDAALPRRVVVNDDGKKS
jgi:small-conductance mechanosensitive channel